MGRRSSRWSPNCTAMRLDPPSATITIGALVVPCSSPLAQRTPATVSSLAPRKSGAITSWPWWTRAPARAAFAARVASCSALVAVTECVGKPSICGHGMSQTTPPPYMRRPSWRAQPGALPSASALRSSSLQRPDRARGEAVAADLVAWEALLLVDHDVVAQPGEEERRGGTCGARPDDDHVRALRRRPVGRRHFRNDLGERQVGDPFRGRGHACHPDSCPRGAVPCEALHMLPGPAPPAHSRPRPAGRGD